MRMRAAAVGFAVALVSCTALQRAPSRFPSDVVVCAAVYDVLPSTVRGELERISGVPGGPNAVTVGPTTFYLRNADDPCLHAHEDVHKAQGRREGYGPFLVRYAAEHARVGYALNRYEEEARRAQETCEAAARWGTQDNVSSASDAVSEPAPINENP